MVSKGNHPQIAQHFKLVKYDYLQDGEIAPPTRLYLTTPITLEIITIPIIPITNQTNSS